MLTHNIATIYLENLGRRVGGQMVINVLCREHKFFMLPKQSIKLFLFFDLKPKIILLESICLQTDMNYLGNDGRIIVNTASPTHCQWECQKDSTCLYFSFDRTNGRCILKTANNSTPTLAITSGPKFCTETKSKYKVGTQDFVELGGKIRGSPW